MRNLRILSELVAFAYLAVTAGCSDISAAPKTDSDVASVIIKVTSPPTPQDNGFGYTDLSSDSILAAAVVVSTGGKLISDLPVTWHLQLSDGSQVADTVAVVKGIGTQQALLLFRRPVLVGIVATVSGLDGNPRSGTLYMNWSPNLDAFSAETPGVFSPKA